MQSLTGLSEEQLIEDLEGVIFRNPEKLDSEGKPVFETSDEYLSGNVREKLKTARQFAEMRSDLYSINVDLIRYAGTFVSIVGIMVFIFAMSTMKDSWRAGIDYEQKTRLITSGIYQYSRNPAFVGFDLFYIGFTFMFSNVFVVIISFVAIIMLHLQILEEEKFLPTVFGEKYLEYKKRVRRYF